jgi:hypothetical protein
MSQNNTRGRASAKARAGASRGKGRAQDPGSKPPDRGLIVGIGASAGGLSAFKSFLSNTPTDSGMAFILGQNLSPDHERVTQMPKIGFPAMGAATGTAQTILPVGKARTLPRSSFSQSAYLVITSRRRSTAVILR